MKPIAAWTLLGAVVAVAAAATLPRWVHGLGVPTWHHNASLLATIVVYAIAATATRGTPRRHQALGVAFWTTLALLSGFLILYLKPELKATDHKDWAKFWHVAWSWLALWYALGHTWLNRTGLSRALRRLGRRSVRAAAYVVPLLLIIIAIPLTWSDRGAHALQEPEYIPLTLWTWLGFVAGPYAAWWFGRAADVSWLGRVHIQNLVTNWLIPMTLAANISGIPILYFGTKDTDLKYVAKYWHTWPSIAMAVLLFAHTVQFWPAMVGHWRRRAAARMSSAA